MTFFDRSHGHGFPLNEVSGPVNFEKKRPLGPPLSSQAQAQMTRSLKTCLQLMDEYDMLENIRVHSFVVARVAHLIARGLRRAGVQVSIGLVTTGALMHDIGKTPSLENGLDHSEIGRQICIDNHLFEVADIVGEHVRLKDYHLDGEYCEKEIVYYADKRVNHDRIVSLEERQAYILERYAGGQERLRSRIRDNFQLCARVEKKLFKKLGFSPESVPRLASNEDIGMEDICAKI